MTLLTSKQIKVLSAIIAILGILATFTPTKVDNQVVRVLQKLLVYANSTV